MPQIQIDTEQVRDVGRRLIAEGDRLNEIGHELHGAISNLDTGAWDGHSRAQAEPLLGRVRPESARVSEDLDELGRTLVRVADTFEHEDNAAAHNLEGMPWVNFELATGAAVVGAAAMARLPATGGDGIGISAAIAGLPHFLPIDGRVARLDELNAEIEDLQQRVNSLSPASGLIGVGSAVLQMELQRKMELRDTLRQTIASDTTPLTKFPYTPGSDIWIETDKAGDCVRYTQQRSDGRIKFSGHYAREMPTSYPPAKQRTLTPDQFEEGSDLRLSGIQPGMAMVWQPGQKMFGVNGPNGDDFTPPPPDGYYDDRRWAADGGHVGIVEEVGSDYIVVSDQYGRHHVGVPLRYHHNGKIVEENVLVGPTFIDLT